MDQFATRELRCWFERFPDYPLPADVLATLLTAGSLLVNEEAFWPKDLASRSRWRAELDALLSHKKLAPIAPHFAMPARGEHPSLFWYYDGLGDVRGMFDDFFSLLYCDRGEIHLSSPRNPWMISIL